VGEVVNPMIRKSENTLGLSSRRKPHFLHTSDKQFIATSRWCSIISTEGTILDGNVVNTKGWTDRPIALAITLMATENNVTHQIGS
jgi:hypothetical protein